jgi:hypothetical protein
MPYFAQLNDENVVIQVIPAGPEYESSGEELYAQIAGGVWKRTSYNSRGGIHYGPDGTPDGGIAFRKNYAGIGYTYDSALDAFIPPKPFPSWLLDTNTCQWQAPKPYPNDGRLYSWDEATQSWIETV